jgi:CRISPR-associated endonuclease/helicase Cas3
LHDIGKISPGFQAKCDAWIKENGLVQDAINGRWKTGCETDHAKVSQWTLQELFNQNEDLFGWAIAVGAHHGKIKGQRITKYNLNGSIGNEKWRQLRLELAKELLALFGPLSTRAPRDADLWWTAGLITVADWIGSDESFFPLDNSVTDAERSTKAAAALNRIQWRVAALRPNLSFSDLFPGLTANALQDSAFTRITRQGAYLLEAPMRCGKTEALDARVQQGVKRSIFAN